MSVREGLAVAMFLAFILGILSGFPVAWVLGGVAVLFTAIAIVVEADKTLLLGKDEIFVKCAELGVTLVGHSGK